MEVFPAFPEEAEVWTNDVMYLNFEVNSNGAMYGLRERAEGTQMPEKYIWNSVMSGKD